MGIVMSEFDCLFDREERERGARERGERERRLRDFATK